MKPSLSNSQHPAKPKPIKMFPQMEGFKERCIRAISNSISVPQIGFMVKRKDSLEFSFSVCGSLTRLSFNTKLDVAHFLRSLGRICEPVLTRYEVKMYTKGYLTITGNKGQPVQMDRPVPFLWEDIHFTYDEVVEIVILSEFNRCCETLGIEMPKQCALPRKAGKCKTKIVPFHTAMNHNQPHAA